MSKHFLAPFLCVGVSFTVTAQVLIDESFNASVLPANWSQATLADDGGWILGDNTMLQSAWWDIGAHGNFIATNDDACDCDKSADYLILPTLDLADANAPILSFASYFSEEPFQGNLEEATIEYSVDAGETWTVLASIEGNGKTDETTWQNVNVNLSEIVGNTDVLIAFHYNDDGGWMFGWAIDDVIVYEPQGLDAALTSLSLPANAALNSDVIVEGVITNVGAELIENVEVTWSIDGGEEFPELFSDLNLGTGESYVFAHSETFTPTSSGTYTFSVSIGDADDNADNNALTAHVSVVEYGTWSGENYDREYIYYHPQNAPTDCPLVFVCHGYSGTAEGIMGYSEFNALADEYGFAVCYPQGIEDSDGYTFFNVGYDFQSGETVDDVAFLESLTALFVETNAIDPAKVFATGMSNGGDLCYLLACEASETFTGVAPIAGMIMQNIMDDCSPTNTVSILEIHGTDDNVTYYDGDYENADGWGAYPSIPETMAFWADLFDIELESTGDFPNTAPTDGSDVSYEKYGADGSCGEVWLYTVNGGGHDWPGSWGNMDISASLEAWLFFNELCQQPVSVTDELGSQTQPRVLVQVVDLLGRTIDPDTRNVPMLYLYDDGSVEKVISFPR